MGEVRGYLKYNRLEKRKEPVGKRVKHYNEFLKNPNYDDLQKQGARCMDCGVPFCHSGCPLGNLIPEWNDLVYNNKWQDAAKRLLSTNNFPEFTGRVCPAPCETSCVVSINQPAVTIKNIELAIIEKAFEENYIEIKVSSKRIPKSIAVVGSGPAGLAAAEELNAFGYSVTVFEKNEVLGGLLRLGIPDFKLEKSIVERRINLMKDAGIVFKTNINIGDDVELAELRDEYSAVVLCGGAEQPRDLNIQGRGVKGIYFAMDYLTQQNRRVGGRIIESEEISAKGKKVVVIGGGDTGADCVGTAIRQGAASVINLELLPKPPKKRADNNPWPEWAKIDRISTSHEEGAERMFSVITKEFIGENGKLKKIKVAKVVFEPPNKTRDRPKIAEIPDSEFEIDADLVILALGFIGVKRSRLLNNTDIKLNEKGNLSSEKYMTKAEGVFTAGDMRTGQSLVVKAINDGRNVAQVVHRYLVLQK